MNGLNRIHGSALSGIDHLRQSVIDILTTPIGSRVMRRDYGSRLYALVDAPLNRQTIVEMYAATAEALQKWEPRLKLTHVRVDQLGVGKICLAIEGIYLPDNITIQLDDIPL